MRATALLLVLTLVGLIACTSTQGPASYDRPPLPDRSYDGEVFRPSDAQLDQSPTIRRPSRVRYPDSARALGLQREVFVTLVVGPDGRTYDVAIDPELNDDTGLNQAERKALRGLEHAAMEAVWTWSLRQVPSMTSLSPCRSPCRWSLTSATGRAGKAVFLSKNQLPSFGQDGHATSSRWGIRPWGTLIP